MKHKLSRILKFILAAVIIAAILFIGLFAYKLFHVSKNVTTDITQYGANYRGSYATEQINSFMPSLDTLSDARSLSFSHQLTSEFLFSTDGVVLLSEWTPDQYAQKKEELLKEYTVVTAPKMNDSGEYLLPDSEFDFNGHTILVVSRDGSLSYRPISMLGFNDSANSIAFICLYNQDLDFIAEANEDPESFMPKYLSQYIAWPE